jgi:hypothetical protein
VKIFGERYYLNTIGDYLSYHQGWGVEAEKLYKQTKLFYANLILLAT